MVNTCISLTFSSFDIVQQLVVDEQVFVFEHVVEPEQIKPDSPIYESRDAYRHEQQNHRRRRNFGYQFSKTPASMAFLPFPPFSPGSPLAPSAPSRPS